MGQLDVDQVLVHSGIVGLKRLGEPQYATGTIPAQTLAIGGSARVNIDVTPPKADCLARVKLKISGLGWTNLTNYWYLVNGSLNLNDVTDALILGAYTQPRNGDVMRTIFQAYNNKAAATNSIPTITIDVKVTFFEYPF